MEERVREITKPDIFHYVYAVLHHPAYRQKYELNLKREFPRIPFYADFWQWVKWGRRLGVPPGQPLRPGMGPRPLQRKHPWRPDHRGQV